MSTPDKATEVVADVAEEVAEQATHIAEVSRGIAGRDLGLALGGFAVGAGLGGFLTFVFTKRKLEEKYNALAAEQIAEATAQMREHYNRKAIALENQADKPGLDELVREAGYASDDDDDEEEYTTSPPMAVTPPAAVVEAADDLREASESKVEETPPVFKSSDVPPKPETRNVFREYADPEEDVWDWHKERSGRSPLRPFVIHREERDDEAAFDGVTYTYYEEDDVLSNERDEVLAGADRERVVGESNLEKFGHGSDDPQVVYIRNPQLEMDIEVVRSPNSYAEEVHGFEPGEPEIRHTMRRRDRRSPDDE